MSEHLHTFVLENFLQDSHIRKILSIKSIKCSCVLSRGAAEYRQRSTSERQCRELAGSLASKSSPVSPGQNQNRNMPNLLLFHHIFCYHLHEIIFVICCLTIPWQLHHVFHDDILHHRATPHLPSSYPPRRGVMRFSSTHEPT